jgi:hypothetical protein
MRVMLLHKLADIPEDYVPPQKLIVSCWTFAVQLQHARCRPSSPHS